MNNTQSIITTKPKIMFKNKKIKIIIKHKKMRGKNKKIKIKCTLCNKDISKEDCFCDKLDYYNENIANIIKIQLIWKDYIKKQHNTLLEFSSLIENNSYIKNCKSNKKKDINSLSYLIRRELSQSDCIKLGTGLEKIFYDIVLQYTNLIDIKPKNKKGKKEKDHLFCDEINKIIYYSEFKSNINLDTEKSKSTYQKCLNIVNELEEKYSDYTIKWGLVACRYISNVAIPNKLKHKYVIIKKNLFGINDYLNLLNINKNFTSTSYSKFVNKLADTMFE